MFSFWKPRSRNWWGNTKQTLKEQFTPSSRHQQNSKTARAKRLRYSSVKTDEVFTVATKLKALAYMLHPSVSTCWQEAPITPPWRLKADERRWWCLSEGEMTVNQLMNVNATVRLFPGRFWLEKLHVTCWHAVASFRLISLRFCSVRHLIPEGEC